jgi:hypothetical protein
VLLLDQALHCDIFDEVLCMEITVPEVSAQYCYLFLYYVIFNYAISTYIMLNSSVVSE